MVHEYGGIPVRDSLEECIQVALAPWMGDDDARVVEKMT